MGYDTTFDGVFKLDKPLATEHALYLKKFSETRRMRRDSTKAAELSDPVREAVGLEIGNQGEFYVGADGFMGQDRDESILDYNYPPSTQPGLWCQWVPSQDGTGIEWDCNEKFYHYIQWLSYIIVNFLKPWGYVLNGKVCWRGEDFEDTGAIIVED